MISSQTDEAHHFVFFPPRISSRQSEIHYFIFLINVSISAADLMIRLRREERIELVQLLFVNAMKQDSLATHGMHWDLHPYLYHRFDQLKSKMQGVTWFTMPLCLCLSLSLKLFSLHHFTSQFLFIRGGISAFSWCVSCWDVAKTLRKGCTSLFFALLFSDLHLFHSGCNTINLKKKN